MIFSGKGGVGKSTLTVTLAHALARIHAERVVGVLDADITGPSVPRMTGAVEERVHVSNRGWEPVWVADNMAMMSVGCLAEDDTQAVIWRGEHKNGVIKQFLRDVVWCDPDTSMEYLLIDTPPGTSDEHITAVQMLKQCGGVTGCILVSTPQELAVQDVRKQLDFCRRVQLNVLGVVENMSGMQCPKCGYHESILPRNTASGVEEMCNTNKVAFLGQVPLDARLAYCCDKGVNFLEEYADAPAAQALLSLAHTLDRRLSSDPSSTPS